MSVILTEIWGSSPNGWMANWCQQLGGINPNFILFILFGVIIFLL
jgi:hypothetical protein